MLCIYNLLCEAVGVCSSVAVRLADEDDGTWWPGTGRREGLKAWACMVWRRGDGVWPWGGQTGAVRWRGRCYWIALDAMGHTPVSCWTQQRAVGTSQESRHRPWLTRLRDLTNRGGHDMRAKQGRGVKTGERQRSDMLRECQESRAVLVFVFFYI